jgi:SSS family solute:Na+ symporter
MTQLAVVAVYLLAVMGLGLAANRLLRATSADYLLASHSIGPVLLLMSLFGTTMTAFALVGSTGQAFQVGAGVYALLASASGIVHPLCFFLVGVKLWGLGRRFGYTTQVQFFRDRLDSHWVGLLLFPVLVGLVIPYLLIGIKGAGDVINGVTRDTFQPWFESSGYGVPQWLASLVVCGVVLTYVFFGGMRGTAWANTFQTAVFMVLGVLTFVTVAKGLGGQESLLEDMRAASSQVEPDMIARTKIPQSVYFSFLLIPLSVAMFPHVFQHWLTARSARTFRLAIVAHPIFIMIVWLPCVLLGVWASAPKAGMEGVPPDQVLAAMVGNEASPVLAGLLTAGILAAVMSSLDSQFLCLGTMFTTDVVAHYGGKNRFSDRQIVLLARGFIVAIVAVTYVLSLISPATVFGMSVWCFSGFTGLFPVVIAAIYWRRLTALGAAAGILTTVVAWAAMFYSADFGANGRYAFPKEPIPLVGGLAIPPMLPVVTITVATALVMIAVSAVTRPPSRDTLSRFFGE